MISSTALHALIGRIAGTVVSPADAGYDAARRLYNAAVDVKPGAIAYCQSVADVQATVAFAREQKLRLAVRSGGCSPTGFSTTDGLVLDVSRIRSIELASDKKSVRVGAGAVLKSVYEALVPQGVVIPAGECLMVGIAGLTLGGGLSLLGRSLGLTCDSLIAAEIVTAAGEVLTVHDDSHCDLFWALRGAGAGNFGVVTSLTFTVHPIPQKLLCGTVVWPLDQAAEVLHEALDHFGNGAPDELNSVFGLFTEKGERKLLAMPVYNGDPEAGREAMARITGLGRPATVDVEPRSFLEFLEGDFHPTGEAVYEYWKSGFADEPLDLATWKRIVEGFAASPADEAMIGVELCGGAINRVDRDASAYVHRDQCYLFSIFADSSAAEGFAAAKAWADQLYRLAAPSLSPARYQNYPDPSLDFYEQAYYGLHTPRLQEVKARYDPDLLFRYEQSLRHPPAPRSPG